jgi:hypothetical protein
MASAQNYLNTLRTTPQAAPQGYNQGGGYQEPNFGRVAPVPDTYDGGFSASRAPTGFASEYAEDPNAPKW